jgi:hypothetical protein
MAITSAITVLNIFLGWTLLGWIAALAWAFTAKRPEYSGLVVPPAPPRENDRRVP